MQLTSEKEVQLSEKEREQYEKGMCMVRMICIHACMVASIYSYSKIATCMHACS